MESTPSLSDHTHMSWWRPCSPWRSCWSSWWLECLGCGFVDGLSKVNPPIYIYIHSGRNHQVCLYLYTLIYIYIHMIEFVVHPRPSTAGLYNTPHSSMWSLPTGHVDHFPHGSFEMSHDRHGGIASPITRPWKKKRQHTIHIWKL